MSFQFVADLFFTLFLVLSPATFVGFYLPALVFHILLFGFFWIVSND